MKILSVLAIVALFAGCEATYPIGENGKYGHIVGSIKYYPNLAGIIGGPKPATVGDK